MTVGPVARNRATEAFFEAAAAGRFLLRRCVDGGHYNRPQAKACSDCGCTDMEDVAAGGAARLVSWVVVPDRPEPGRTPGPPDLPAIVEFEEGPWWWSKLVDADPDRLEEGQQLRVVFERADQGEVVPVFTPAGDRPE